MASTWQHLNAHSRPQQQQHRKGKNKKKDKKKMDENRGSRSGRKDRHQVEPGTSRTRSSFLRLI